MTRRRWLLLAGTAAVLVWLAFCAVLLVRASGDLREGRDAASRARDGLDAEAIAEATALPDLERAYSAFRSAGDAVGHPLLAPLKILPVLGRQLRSVDALAGAAEEVSGAAASAVEDASTLLEDPATGPAARLRQVQLLDEVVVRAHDRVMAVDDLGPRVGLFSPLADARNDVAADLDEARQTLSDAVAGSAAALRLLEGPRNYLLVAANNAEMRAGSGMWLSGGLMQTAGGRLSLGEVAPLYVQADVPDGLVPIDDRDLAARWGDRHPEGDWRRLMFSPRLAASAQLGAAMWSASGQPPVDGVLVVDPVALAAVVRATGPITLEDGRVLGADDIVPELTRTQYDRFDIDEREERRSALAVVARAAFAALDEGRWTPTTLARELGDVVRGRHLLAWSSDPVEQRGWIAAGLSGALQPDSLALSILNRGGNKLDPFLKVESELVTEPSAGGTDVTVRLTFTNEAPEGLSSYAAGPPTGGTWARGEYIGLVTLNVPAAAEDARFVAGQFDSLQGADGPTRVIAAELRLLQGESTTLEATFRLRGERGRMTVEPSARVPAVAWSHGSQLWEDSARRVAKW